MEAKITVLKQTTINGKVTRKSFTFQMDAKKMAAKCKTEASVKKHIKEYVIQAGIFRKDELPYLKYNMKDFLAEWKKQLAVVNAEEQKRLDSSENNPGSRITPARITRLASNEVFVFGSNAMGMHGGGAARYAYEHFGAVMGQSEGLQGKSFGINTMSGLDEMAKSVNKFIAFAKDHPDKRFLVTPIGCGIAGYSAAEVAPLFKDCKDLENVTLPDSFWKVINQ